MWNSLSLNDVGYGFYLPFYSNVAGEDVKMTAWTISNQILIIQSQYVGKDMNDALIELQKGAQAFPVLGADKAKS